MRQGLDFCTMSASHYSTIEREAALTSLAPLVAATWHMAREFIPVGPASAVHEFLWAKQMALEV